MMEVESLSCIRSLNVTPDAVDIVLRRPSSPPPRCPSPFQDTTLHKPASNMVVESQSHGLRPPTPDPLPEPSIKERPLYQSVPLNGVMTPSPDNPPAMEYSSAVPMPNGQHEQPLGAAEGMSLLKYPHIPDSLSSADGDMDRSPPDLSPKALDQETSSQGSPSQNGEKARARSRKPTLEDIVRRMKEAESSYYSEDSDDEQMMMGEIRGSLLIDMERGMDEVDGSTPENVSSFAEGEKLDIDIPRVSSAPPPFTNGDLALQTVLSEPQRPSAILENMPKISTKTGMQSNGHIRVSLETTVANTIADVALKQQQDFLMPKLNGWFHGPFNNIPMFPFPHNPLDQHLPPNFLPMFDGKFAMGGTQEAEKDYLKCHYCERTFRRQKNLENHIENTHHGKSPLRKKSENGTQSDMYFKCTHCPYTTKHQSNLYVHLRIHTGERPYICGACGVQYSQSHSLKSHIINKHDGIMSYYIKEKRTRSPRGLGYMTTQVLHDGHTVYKMPAGPPPLASHVLPSLQLPPLPQLTANGLQHTPHLPKGGLMEQRSPFAPHMQSPHARAQQAQQQALPPQPGPVDFTSHSIDLSKSLMELQHAQMQVSPTQHQLHHHQQQGLHESSLHQQHHHQQQQLSKSSPAYLSPSFPMNGHNGSPNHYNGLQHHYKHLFQSEQALSPITPYQRNHTPLQEIRNIDNFPLQRRGNGEEEGNCGAMDLTKKPKENVDIVSPRGQRMDTPSMKCLDRAECRGNCINCIHSMKLRMLRMNVVRMLSILVPNLNFEEKGISADGDSVDELLRDVIESNMQDDEMSE